MSVRDFDPHSPSDAAPAPAHPRPHRKATAQRYAAVVAALIDVRPDEATARFDRELAKAMAEHRIDEETARTLRWWQRASVRAADTYAATVLPQVLEMRDEAEAHAKAEADEAAASWAAAQKAKATHREPEAPVAELAAVPMPAARPTVIRRHTTDETRRAVRAAFALVDTDPETATPTPDLATTVVTMVSTHGKDARRNADPATSA